MTYPALLVADNVRLVFHTPLAAVTALDGVSLSIADGEFVAIVGPSGCGKTSLLRLLAGLIAPTSGSVLLRGETLGGPRPDIGFVFQQPTLMPWRTALDNVMLPLELRNTPLPQRRQRAVELLAMVGLAGFEQARPRELSGGMQQRVGLARAFVTDAPILLMDEPFSALDPLIRARLQDELLDLQAKLKRTIIFVSHDLDEAFKLGNRIALMEGGRIVQIGTAREIIANPSSDYVADFVAHMNPLGVLTARDVMEQGESNGAGVDCETAVKAVMQRLAQGEAELTVTERGAKIGVIRAAGLMAKLINPRGSV